MSCVCVCACGCVHMCMSYHQQLSLLIVWYSKYMWSIFVLTNEWQRYSKLTNNTCFFAIITFIQSLSKGPFSSKLLMRNSSLRLTHLELHFLDRLYLYHTSQYQEMMYCISSTYTINRRTIVCNCVRWTVFPAVRPDSIVIFVREDGVKYIVVNDIVIQTSA